MAISHNIHSNAHPTTKAFFLSRDEIRACYDIDRNGIDKANRDSLMKLEFLVACLTSEVLNFIKTYPHTHPAGLMLNVDVLLPVYEEIDESVFMELDNDNN